MSKKKLFIILGIALVFVVFIGIAVINSGKISDASSKATLSVNTELASIQEIISEVTVKGTIKPIRVENLYSTSINKVEQLLVREGDGVKSGDLLIAYDEKELEKLKSQLEQAQLNLDIQKLNSDNALKQSKDGVNQSLQMVKQFEVALEQTSRTLEKAKETLANNQKLYEAGAISTEQLNASKEQVLSLEEKLELDKVSLDNAKYNLNTANENYNNMQSDSQSVSKLQVQLQEKQIEDLKKNIQEYDEAVVSPIDGTILKINVSEGDYTSGSLPVIQVADLSTLIVEANVSEYEAVNLQIGQKVTIKNNSLSEIFNGEVTKVYPMAEMSASGNSQINAVKVEITLLNKDAALKPGYTVDATITLDVKEDAVVIPILATIKEKDGGYFTYVVTEDNLVKKTPIELGLISDLYVEAIGLKEGEQVIVNPSPKIEDGSIVSPILKTKGDETND